MKQLKSTLDKQQNSYSNSKRQPYAMTKEALREIKNMKKFESLKTSANHNKGSLTQHIKKTNPKGINDLKKPNYQKSLDSTVADAVIEERAEDLQLPELVDKNSMDKSSSRKHDSRLMMSHDKTSKPIISESKSKVEDVNIVQRRNIIRNNQKDTYNSLQSTSKPNAAYHIKEDVQTR